MFDRDNSGSIDVVELKDAMKALGVFLKKEEIRDKMQKVDKDGSGAIDKGEFMALMAELLENRDQEEEMRKVFRVYDEDDNGMISHTNLVKCAEEIGEEVTDEEIRSMIEMTECGKKYAVSIEDFIKVMKMVGLITSGSSGCGGDEADDHEHE